MKAKTKHHDQHCVQKREDWMQREVHQLTNNREQIRPRTQEHDIIVCDSKCCFELVYYR